MKSFTLCTLGLVSLLPVAGCSSAPPQSSTSAAAIMGTVSNTPLSARSAIARYGTVATSTVNGTTTDVRGLTVVISDKANTCSSFHSQGSTNLVVTIPGDAPPGTYPVVNAASSAASAGQSEVDFNAVDNTCMDTVATPATTGTVTLTSVIINVVGAGHSIVSGTLDATFAGGHLAGDFDAVLCPDAANVTDAGPDAAPTCMP
jgi:hypothetical protein